MSTPTVVNGAAALFAGVWPATDAIVRPDALGVTTILQLRFPEAPTSFSWEVGLGPGQRLRQLADGDVAVVEGPPAPAGPPWEGPLGNALEAPSATALGQAIPGELRPQETQAQYAAAMSSVAAAEQQTGGTALMVVEPPTAADAHGSGVSTSLSVVGSTLTVSVSPVPTTVFPVMVTATVAARRATEPARLAPQSLRYGLSDQRAAAFGPAFDRRLLEGPLHVRVARLVLPYEAVLGSTEGREEKEKAERRLEFTQGEALIMWLRKVQEVNAKGEHLEPYITLWSKGCLDRRVCRAPPIKRYREAVRVLIKDSNTY